MARLLEETAVMELERRKTDALVHQADAALRIAEADNQAVLLQLETRRLARLLAAEESPRRQVQVAVSAAHHSTRSAKSGRQPPRHEKQRRLNTAPLGMPRKRPPPSPTGRSAALNGRRTTPNAAPTEMNSASSRSRLPPC
jgi:hypothetical protein